MYLAKNIFFYKFLLAFLTLCLSSKICWFSPHVHCNKLKNTTNILISFCWLSFNYQSKTISVIKTWSPYVGPRRVKLIVISHTSWVPHVVLSFFVCTFIVILLRNCTLHQILKCCIRFYSIASPLLPLHPISNVVLLLLPFHPYANVSPLFLAYVNTEALLIT